MREPHDATHLPFDLEQSNAAAAALTRSMARPFLYRCPTIGSQVQGSVEGEPHAADERQQYEAVECAACCRFHLVNVATLKLLAEENEN